VSQVAEHHAEERKASGSSKQAAVAWLVAAVFYFYQYVLRSVPSVMMPQLSQTFGLSALGLASLAGLFYYRYSPFRLVAGATPDRFGVRRMMSIAAAITLTRCRSLSPTPTAVAHPCDLSSLSGAIEAGNQGLIELILVGPRARIEAAAESANIDLKEFKVINAPHSVASAAKAVELLREAQAELLMKGSLHTDEVMGAVVSREGGLRTEHHINHVFVMYLLTYHKVLIVTDGAINIAPTLEHKVDICQNAIDLAISLGLERPKAAILTAVDTVNSKMPATLDAAALCKMAERGQIKGAILDGPLAFDNAFSKEAAKTKGIVSEVAGDPDIVLALTLPGKAIDFPRQGRQCRSGVGGESSGHSHKSRRQRSIAHRELRSGHACCTCPAEETIRNLYA
jgi:phosphate acetyltransferase